MGTLVFVPRKAGKGALFGAYKKGGAAFLAGQALTDCPYPDTRKDNGRLTWSRAFRTAWSDGWRDAERQQREGAANASV